jgi:hypothetical protein
MLKTKSLFSVFFLLLLIGEILLYFFVDDYSQTVDLVFFLSLVIAIVAITIVFFVICNHSTAKELGALRAVVLFLISYIIVHFQFYLDFVFDISRDRLLRNSVSSIIKSSLLSLIGLHSFLLAYINTKNNVVRKPRYTLSSIHFSTGLLKILTSLSLLWLLYCGRGYYFRMTYGSVSLVGSQLAYAMLIFSLFKNSTFLLCVYEYQSNNNKSIIDFIKSLGLLFNLTLLLHVVATLSSGDRGPAIYSIIGYLVAISVSTSKKIRYSQFAVLLVGGALFISLWGIVRTSKSTENISGQITNAYSDLKKENSLIPATKEMAGSVRTLHVSVENVPEFFPHTNGIFQLSYIFQSIPFYSRLFPTLRSSVGFNNSAVFLTWVINGDTEASGVGTTCIADIYIDLGLIGVIILLFLWGIAVKRSELLFSVPLSSLSLFQVSLAYIVVSISVYIPRSAILFSLKDVVWLFIALFLFALFSSNKEN